MLRALVCIALLTVACDEPGTLPEISVVPAFALTDQRDAGLTDASLAGAPWVANFMFTSCPDVCPRLTMQMIALRKRLSGHAGRVHYVSFSVDPETDTPAVLLRYAQERGADFPDWHFVTGDTTRVKQVVVEGFKQAMEPVREPDKPFNVLHGSHFVLVDAGNVIRGFYASDNHGIAELGRDVERLLAAGGR